MTDQARRPTKPKKENFTLRLEPARKERLLQLADARGLSPSELVRELVVAALNRHEQQT